MFRRTLLATALATPAIIGGASSRAATMRKVRYASVGGSTDAGIFVGMDDGIFAAAGIDLDYQTLNNAATLLSATATEQLDVAGISLTPGLLASIERGIQIRVVGDKESIRKGFAATQMIVRTALMKPTLGETLQALKGHKFAISGRASASFVLLGLTAAKYGILLDQFDIIELSYANMVTAFANGAIDGAIALEPFLSKLLLSGGISAVSDFTDVVPPVGGSIVPIVYSEKFAADQAFGRDFMVAYLKAVRVYNDAIVSGQGRERMFEIIAKHTGMGIDVVRASTPSGYDINQFVSRDFFEEVERFFLAQKLLRNPVDVGELMDPSFAQYAVSILGRQD